MYLRNIFYWDIWKNSFPVAIKNATPFFELLFDTSMIVTSKENAGCYQACYMFMPKL